MARTPFAELCADIKEHGLQHPIVLHEQQILDGRNRLLACKEARVNPKFIQFADLQLTCTPEEYIWSANLQRRHLTDDQRAAIVIEWKAKIAQQANERQRAAGGDKKSQKAQQKSLMANSPEAILTTAVESSPRSTGEPGERLSSVTNERPRPAATTRQMLAKQAEVTEHKIKLADRVQTECPELLEKVREGSLTLAQAQHKIAPEPTTVKAGAEAEEGAPAASAELVGRKKAIAKKRKSQRCSLVIDLWCRDRDEVRSLLFRAGCKSEGGQINSRLSLPKKGLGGALILSTRRVRERLDDPQVTDKEVRDWLRSELLAQLERLHDEQQHGTQLESAADTAGDAARA
jgi:ParB-like chromosome segregation protein Spo0J